MGLDMYLTGEKYYRNRSDAPVLRDGFPLRTETLDLGYWRKHPNLHGYIVQTCAADLDECQEIRLDGLAIEEIITAVETDSLPETTGFFFGKSDPSDKAPTLEILKAALAWLQTDEPQVIRTVIYRASW